MNPTPATHVAPLSVSSHNVSPWISGGFDPRGGGSPHAAGSESEATNRPRALVVDDAPDVTEMIGMLMSYAGYEVVTAFSATEAFDAARSGSFDVIISDIGMPGMNGYELAEALRALPAYRSVPLIAVTGFSMYDDRTRALSSGFNDFLTKPINPGDLLDVVKRLV
ncbi:MAG TPA: response regulator [Pyrinomonadaceae bacterium]|nr:response regulator [Pyrinomonadaceae bacterium]